MEVMVAVWIDKARGGDIAALNALFSLYRKPLLYTIERIVKNKEDAEDILIITLQKAFLHFDQFEDNYAFSTWLFKIGSNTAIDFLRRKNNQHQSVNKDNHISLDRIATKATADDDPLQWYEKEQRISIMKILINKLSDDDRQLILWRYYEELTYDEIALHLNAPVGTIKTRLFRIRKLLLRWVEKAFKEL